MGTTLLFVSHDMGMVKNFCQYAVYLDQGTEKAKGRPLDIAELYFLDIRDEQRRTVEGDHGGVKSKPFAGNGDGVAFGTDEGHIVSASFSDSGGLFSSYMSGEEVEVVVEAKYMDSVMYPYVSLLIQDRRLMDIGGGFFALRGSAAEGQWKTASVTARFKADLAPGRYHITVRLENRPSENIFEPMDKQVGLLAFEIINSEKTFLGTVNLGFRGCDKTPGGDA